MKKIILSCLMLIALSFNVNAQKGQGISKNALGLRFGSNYGTEISYQRKLSKNNRFEANLGWDDGDHYDSFKLTGLYQWLWNIDGGFNWYVGAGAGIGSYDDNYHDDYNDGGFATLDGDIGIEYDFDFPLQIALDLRPEIYFGNDSDYHDDHHDHYHDDYWDIGLALRYRF